MFVFRKMWRTLFSCNIRLEILPCPLLPTIYSSLREKFEVYSGLPGILLYLVPGKYGSEKISNLGTVYAVHRITLLLKNQLQYKYVQVFFEI